jgi:hypothetical protein
MPFGRVQQDKIWQPVIERTGGRFYAAPDEESIFKALAEIDRLSPGQDRGASIQRPAPAVRRVCAHRAAHCGRWPRVMKLGFSYVQEFSSKWP